MILTIYLDTSVPKKTRSAVVQLTTGGAFNLKFDMSHEEKTSYIHEVLSPAIYQFGDAAYYRYVNKLSFIEMSKN